MVALVWLGSGFFIVQEGQQAVVSTFGKYSYTSDAGFQWRFPYPFQAHETVPVTQLRSVEIGRNNVVQATGLRDSSMLTQDENIVDIRFTVQYRLKDARAYLFENRNPDEAVVQAAESAVREIVGRSKVDSVLYEQREALATDLVKSIQAQLDRLKAGIVIVNVNVQNVQVPEQVQAAFNDAVKAGADRDRLKNEGQAYSQRRDSQGARHRGAAARRGRGLPARVIAQADGDAQRFRSVLTEYQKRARGDARPAVHRDDAAGVLQRQQGDGRQPQRLEPAVPAAGQAAAAGRRARRRAATAPRRRRRRPPRRPQRPPMRARATAAAAATARAAEGGSGEQQHESHRIVRRRRC